DLEERQDVAAGVISGAAEKEAFASQESPQSVAEEEVVEGWCSSQVRRRGIHGNRSKLESIANGVVCQKGKNIGREIQHHQMTCILLANQSAGEQRKASLHEQNQVPGVQRPSEVGGDSNVP